MPRGFTEQDDALLAELGIEVKPKKIVRYTPREERIIAGFGEIQRFVDEHGRTPQRGDHADIFERLHAVRLERIREKDECRTLLEPLDRDGLLGVRSDHADKLDDDALLAELGVQGSAPTITELRHVRSSAEKRMAAEIASRVRCEDFERYRPLFAKVQRELDAGIRVTRPFQRKAEIEPGRFFVVGGQKAYVAEMGHVFTQEYGDKDARLRVVFDNGTESNMLRRSLQRALHKDDAGRRITEPTAGPLFTGLAGDGDEASGTIYVLRSKSEDPRISKHRDLIHKIGVTRGSVEKRIAGAPMKATYLLADVEVVATYRLYNVDRTKLEHLIHRVFGSARLDIEIRDRFGNPVVPREWFLVPLDAIDEAVERIRDGTITRYKYDADAASFVS